MAAKKIALECAPIAVTSWDRIYMDNGSVIAVVRSGDKQFAWMLSPHAVLEGIELARRALIGGGVTPLLRKPPAPH